MGGKKDKKKKDPLKKAALAAKKEAKADKAALKRMQKEQDRLSSLSIRDDDHADGDGKGGGKNGKRAGDAADDLDSLLESYRNRTSELSAFELEALDTPFPRPPRGNFTLTLCPSNGMFYMVRLLSSL